MESIIASTAAAASAFDKSVASTTASTNSFLFIVPPPQQHLNHYSFSYYICHPLIYGYTCNRPVVLKMPLKIHAVMQDADDKHLILLSRIKDNMRLLADAPQSRCHLLRAATELRVGEQGAEAGVKLVAIEPGLVDAEFGNGVIGYFGQIICGAPA
tara:strand:- start:126 stop:593 length:468 start_codon:yes stop_codon:yes gene_type:complete